MTQDIKFHTADGFCNTHDKGIFHGFFTRAGGQSSDVYAGLNCGIGSGDIAANVIANRALVARRAGVAAENLLSVYQEHGPNVVHVTQSWSERPKADSMVTDKPGYALGILTADCAPVLFYGVKEDNSPVIGAAHAGWKGALSGVLCGTVSEMMQLGAQHSSIQACVGPCIGKQSYEVSADFVEPFLEENEESERFFHAASKEGYLMFDLAGYCAWRLARASVGSVSILDKDTYANEEEFYSYRRMTHQQEEDYGRQISVIAII